LTVAVILAIFIGVLTQATFGFGSAVIAMPLIALAMGLKIATPLVALGMLLTNICILFLDWRQINWRATWRILLASTLGMPFGLLLIVHAPASLAKGILGIILIGYGLYSLLPTRLPEIKSENWAYPFGFLGGVLGAAYNVNGPPVVIYAALRRWKPDRFRATLSGYFLPSGLLVAIGHGLSGLWTLQMWKLLLYSLPGILLAIWLGNRWNKRLDPGKFDRYIYTLVIVMGILMLLL
jgi:uncharacterized membrane protein YfcA